MIEGISYCHHQHIAHRDLKPENFLFLNRDSMNLKLIDFGLSYQWKDSMKK
jgi:calcium-dependent protein kinase